MGTTGTLLALTAVTIIVSMARAYWVSRDSFHPMVFLGPMIFYAYVFMPTALFVNGVIMDAFRSRSQLHFVLLFNLLSIACFCFGCLWRASGRVANEPRILHKRLSEAARRRLYTAACVCGAWAVACYSWSIIWQGGFTAVYSRPYGGGVSNFAGASAAHSAYFHDAYLFGCPAVMQLAIACQGRRLRVRDYLLAMLFIAPILTIGILGARRSSLFAALVTIGLSWCIAAKRRVSLRAAAAGLGVLAAAVFFVFAYRDQIYLGSKFRLEREVFSTAVLSIDRQTSNEFLVSSAVILASARAEAHSFGLNTFWNNLIVRAIPRQLWPTKYQDLAFQTGPRAAQTVCYGISRDTYLSVVGWFPAYGCSCGFVAGFFLEFAWGAVVACLLFGLFWSYVWQRASSSEGLWQVLFLLSMGLSIFVPMQGFTAFLWRFVLLGGVASLVWMLFVSPCNRSRVNTWCADLEDSKPRSPKRA